MQKTAQSPTLSPETLMELFEQIPEVAFFVKDLAGRYTAVNASLLRRSGLRDRSDLLGRSVHQIFPPDLADRFDAQDAAVLRTGRPVRDQLELHWTTDRRRGWCLTTKLPLRDSQNRITGLIGISRDVSPPDQTPDIPEALARSLTWLQQNYQNAITAGALATRAGLPPVRFARLTKKLFGLSPQQIINQTRLQAAATLLETTRQTIAEIATACGFIDHSAFTRAFKSALGHTPTQHRQHRPLSQP